MDKSNKGCLGHTEPSNETASLWVTALKELTIVDFGCGHHFTVVICADPDQKLQSNTTRELQQKTLLDIHQRILHFKEFSDFKYEKKVAARKKNNKPQDEKTVEEELKEFETFYEILDNANGAIEKGLMVNENLERIGTVKSRETLPTTETIGSKLLDGEFGPTSQILTKPESLPVLSSKKESERQPQKRIRPETAQESMRDKKSSFNKIARVSGNESPTHGYIREETEMSNNIQNFAMVMNPQRPTSSTTARDFFIHQKSERRTIVSAANHTERVDFIKEDEAQPSKQEIQTLRTSETVFDAERNSKAKQHAFMMPSHQQVNTDGPQVRWDTADSLNLPYKSQSESARPQLDHWRTEDTARREEPKNNILELPQVVAYRHEDTQMTEPLDTIEFLPTEESKKPKKNKNKFNLKLGKPMPRKLNPEVKSKKKIICPFFEDAGTTDTLPTAGSVRGKKFTYVFDKVAEVVTTYQDVHPGYIVYNQQKENAQRQKEGDDAMEVRTKRTQELEASTARQPDHHFRVTKFKEGAIYHRKRSSSPGYTRTEGDMPGSRGLMIRNDSVTTTDINLLTLSTVRSGDGKLVNLFKTRPMTAKSAKSNYSELKSGLLQYSVLKEEIPDKQIQLEQQLKERFEHQSRRLQVKELWVIND